MILLSVFVHCLILCTIDALVFSQKDNILRLSFKSSHNDTFRHTRCGATNRLIHIYQNLPDLFPLPQCSLSTTRTKGKQYLFPLEQP